MRTIFVLAMCVLAGGAAAQSPLTTSQNRSVGRASAEAAPLPSDELGDNIRICRAHRRFDPNAPSLPHRPAYVWEDGWEHCEKFEEAHRRAEADRAAKAKANSEPDRQRTLEAAKALR